MTASSSFASTNLTLSNWGQNMAVIAKSKPVSIKARTKKLLEFAQEQVELGQSGPELFIVVFGPHGKARTLFTTEQEWAAFHRCEEIKSIYHLIESVAATSSPSTDTAATNGCLSLTLRLPKSVHAALLQEAATEGVPLDQLCLSKLVAQLRELV